MTPDWSEAVWIRTGAGERGGGRRFGKSVGIHQELMEQKVDRSVLVAGT